MKKITYKKYFILSISLAILIGNNNFNASSTVLPSTQSGYQVYDIYTESEPQTMTVDASDIDITAQGNGYSYATPLDGPIFNFFQNHCSDIVQNNGCDNCSITKGLKINGVPVTLPSLPSTISDTQPIMISIHKGQAPTSVPVLLPTVLPSTQSGYQIYDIYTELKLQNMTVGTSNVDISAEGKGYSYATPSDGPLFIFSSKSSFDAGNNGCINCSIAKGLKINGFSVSLPSLPSTISDSHPVVVRIHKGQPPKSALPFSLPTVLPSTQSGYQIYDIYTESDPQIMTVGTSGIDITAQGKGYSYATPSDGPLFTFSSKSCFDAGNNGCINCSITNGLKINGIPVTLPSLPSTISDSHPVVVRIHKGQAPKSALAFSPPTVLPSTQSGYQIYDIYTESDPEIMTVGTSNVAISAANMAVGTDRSAANKKTGYSYATPSDGPLFTASLKSCSDIAGNNGCTNCNIAKGLKINGFPVSLPSLPPIILDSHPILVRIHKGQAPKSALVFSPPTVLPSTQSGYQLYDIYTESEPQNMKVGTVNVDISAVNKGYSYTNSSDGSEFSCSLKSCTDITGNNGCTNCNIAEGLKINGLPVSLPSLPSTISDTAPVVISIHKGQAPTHKS